jgi:hypothetical protein
MRLASEPVPMISTLSDGAVHTMVEGAPKPTKTGTPLTIVGFWVADPETEPAGTSITATWFTMEYEGQCSGPPFGYPRSSAPGALVLGQLVSRFTSQVLGTEIAAVP